MRVLCMHRTVCLQVVTNVGHFLLTNPRTRGAFDAIAASPTTGNILTSVSGWTPAVGGVITSSSSLMGDLFTFTGNVCFGLLHALPSCFTCDRLSWCQDVICYQVMYVQQGKLSAAPPGRKLMQAAVVTPTLVTGNPLVDGAAAVGQLVGPFLTSGIGAMSSLGTGLSGIASAVSTVLSVHFKSSCNVQHWLVTDYRRQALAGETALIVGKIAPKAVAAVAAAVTIGQIVKEKIAIEAGTAAAATSSAAGAVYVRLACTPWHTQHRCLWPLTECVACCRVGFRAQRMDADS